MTDPVALQIIQKFEAKTSPGAFPWIARSTVAQQLKARLMRPQLISQGQAGMCTIAAIVYPLARQRPQEYVRAVTELFDTGKTRVSNLAVEADIDLRNYKVNPAQIPEADWIIMASIRDSSNFFLDYQSIDDSGGGTGHDIAHWIKKMGYKDIREDWNNKLMNSGISNLKEAGRLYKRGYQVLLRVDSNIISGQKSFLSTANHWVVLASLIHSKLETYQDSVTLNVYTWGSIYNLPKDKKTKLGEFLDYYYGYIACKF